MNKITKGFISFLYLIITFLGCGNQGEDQSKTTHAKYSLKSLNVTATRTITSKSDGHFQHPEFSSDSKKIYFTSSNYNGIYAFDLVKDQYYTITTEIGSGYHFALSDDGARPGNARRSWSDKPGLHRLLKPFRPRPGSCRSLATPSVSSSCCARPVR